MLKSFAIMFLTSMGAMNIATADKVSDLKQELGLVNAGEPAKEKLCRMILVHHGDTDWTVEERLQGIIDIPLNQTGKQQMKALAATLAKIPFSQLYSSDLKRAAESAAIIADKRDCAIVYDPLLRGESHGVLEGKKKEEYSKDPHFAKYQVLVPEEKLFVPIGIGGESKADVAKRIIPELKKIGAKYPGQTVVIVTHGGVFKALDYLLDKKAAAREEFVEIAHGKCMEIRCDGKNLFTVASE